MQRLLAIADDQMLPFLDATDALAAAYCHHLSTMQRGVKGTLHTATATAARSRKSSASWADFAKNNAERIRR